MIPIKSLKEIEVMRQGGMILAEITDKVVKKAVPGITTKKLSRFAQDLLLKYGKPSFKNYNGFPASICTSINNEVVHGIPSERVMVEGDVLSIDLGLLYKNFHTDMAVTINIGDISEKNQQLIKTCQQALEIGINNVKENVSFNFIGSKIQEYVESKGFTVMKNFCGHGIGRELHEDPQILNFYYKKDTTKIKKGMVFCLEPIISNGSWQAEKLKDGFTYVTKDGSFAAHFEHTVAVTEKGVEVLTKKH